MKRTLIAATVLALAGTLSSCAVDDEPKADPTPTKSASPSPSASTTPTASPSADSDAWREEFTDEQLQEFDYALRKWRRYGELMDSHRSEPPEDPKDVREVFEKYTYNATGLFHSYVMNYVEGGVRIVTPPTPVSVTGRKIEANEKGSLVVFDQCNDYTTLDIRRDGKPIEGASPTKNDTAIIRVQMGYEPATDTLEGGWRILTSKVVDKPCA
ncbi:hypothetical protein [Nocardioides sp.]|uniref:hypothetical protein n=1 Tax=Nocardioides sp. TaxID=35761 RepID=UPI0027366900|nr:hypothetical protein [Nocardioides sp.]MDP3889749.1 hypothetical protein [Nocardioides sp.]